MKRDATNTKTSIHWSPADWSMAEEQKKDSLLQTIFLWKTVGVPELAEILTESEVIKKIWHMRDQIIIVDSVLYRERKDEVRQVLMPKHLRDDFLKMCHSGMTGGHMGVRRTRMQVRRRAYWPGWSKDTFLFCRSCPDCNRYRQGRPPKQAKLIPIPCGAPWEILSVDVTGPHPKSSKGHIYIFTMMDYFTKFVEAVPIRNQEAATLAKVIVEKICAVYGTPMRLLSDRGPAFESELFREMCKVLNIEKIRTTSYEPRTNGLIERFHRTMNQMIGKMVEDNHRNWHEVLPIVAATFRASVHESTGFSPNFLIFGRENVMPIDIVYGSSQNPQYIDQSDYAKELRETLQYAYETVRKNLKVAAERRCRGYDFRIREKVFRKGDKVWVFVPKKRRFHYPKWEKYYQGPFEVIEQTGPVNYRVQKLPRGRSVVVHVDKLILYQPSSGAETEETSAREANVPGEIDLKTKIVTRCADSSPRSKPERWRKEEEVVTILPKLRSRNDIVRPQRYRDG